MSIVASEPSQAPLQAVPASPLPAVRPQIAAMRRMLVKRFPSLAFAVRTNGLPLYEVLLATDRSLFDPANASRRTPSTFYSSRQDGGLRRTSGPDEVYLVPSAVVRGFASSTPKPSAIYYTVVGYTAPDGSSPSFPQPPESLALTAPSVGIAPDFTGDTVAAGLSLRGNPLRLVSRAADVAAPAAPAPAPAVAPAPAPAVSAPAPASTAPIDPATDAAGGEDGFSVLAAHPDQAGAPVPAPAPVAPAPLPAPAQPAAEPLRPASGGQYDDGYDDSYDDGWNGASTSGSHALDASFPAGLAEPAQLAGEDDGTDALATWAPAASLSGVDDRYPYRQLDDPAPPAPAAAPVRPVLPAPLQLTIDDKKAIVQRVAGSESGADGYSAINADGEFAGAFGTTHPAYQRYHVGLSYGIIQFTQDSGNLGRLLSMMRDRDAATFAATFGSDGDELVRTATAAGPPASESPDGRSARTQPVGGADLWQQPWLDRFRAAGRVDVFQAAQNELASSAFIDPMLPFCGNLGLDTDRAVTTAVDRAVQMGPAGARQWISVAAGPISTPALRQQALAALGFDDLASFQRAYGQEPDNLWGPLSHAALVGVLRGLGAASPIPLPTLDQMLDALVRRADGDAVFWAARVRALRAATDFTDRPYTR